LPKNLPLSLLLNLGVEGRSALLGTIVADIHRIKIRLPSGAEFDAEGSPADVKAQYDAFLELMKAAPQVPAKPAEAQENDKKNQSPMPPLGDGPEPDDALMKRIFDIATDGLVSLKVLPRGDNAQAQGLLLLLYGYRRISQIENVYAVTLSRAAAKSGIQFERLDRAMEPNTTYARRGGLRRGATYTLNNQGIAHAAQIAMTLPE
jgi:hypothetical protein